MIYGRVEPTALKRFAALITRMMNKQTAQDCKIYSVSKRYYALSMLLLLHWGSIRTVLI